MPNQQTLELYCNTCVRSVSHKEITEVIWTCLNCESEVVLPKHSRFNQLFQECKIKLIASTQLPKIFEAYAKCELEIGENPDTILPVSLAKQGMKIQLNPVSAKYIPNHELEKMFLSLLHAVIAYRVKY